MGYPDSFIAVRNKREKRFANNGIIMEIKVMVREQEKEGEGEGGLQIKERRKEKKRGHDAI